MADIEKITISGQDYDIVDAGARQSLGNKQPKLTSANAGANVTITEESGVVKINSTGGSGGTTDYTALTNKPQIGGTTLTGNKTLAELGIQPTLTSANAGTNVTITTTGGTLKINSTATGGTTDYEDLDNKPSINSTELSGELTSEDLGLQSALTSGEGIEIDDNEIYVKTDGVSIEFNSDGELISGVKETAFRGEFATWALVPEDEDDYLPDHNQSSAPTANDYIVITDASDYEAESFTIKFTKPQQDRISCYINNQLSWTINSKGESTSFYEGPYGDLNIYNNNGNLEIVGLRNFNSLKEGDDEPIRVLTRGLLQVEWKNNTESYSYTITPLVATTDGKWVFHQVAPDFQKSRWLPAYRLDKDAPINFTSGNHVVAAYDQEMKSYQLESKSLLATIDRDTMYDPAEDREIKVFTDSQKIVVWENINRDGTQEVVKELVPGRFYRNTRQEETTEMIEVVRVENIYSDYDIDETALKAALEDQFYSGVGQLRAMYWTADSGEVIQAVELYDYITDEVTMYMRTDNEGVVRILARYGITLEVVDSTKPCAFYVYFTTGYHPIVTTTAGVDKTACHVDSLPFITEMQRKQYKKIAFTQSVSSNGISIKVVYTDRWNREIIDPTNYTADDANEYFYDNYGIYLPFYDDNPDAKTGDYVSYTLSSESLLNDWVEIDNPYDEASKVITENDTKMSFWVGTQTEYDAITTKSNDTLYIIK